MSRGLGDVYKRQLLDLPSWIAELPVPVFFAVLGIQAVIEIWKLVSGQPIPMGGHE